MRRLFQMAEGRDRMLWRHTAALLAGIARLFDPKASPEQFDPYHHRDHDLAALGKSEGGMAALKTLVLSGAIAGLMKK